MQRRGTIIVKVARDARTGRFITLRQAKRHPRSTVVETVRRRVRFRRWSAS
jgi:hypothetical protein